jgi:predicted amidohydrolase
VLFTKHYVEQSTTKHACIRIRGSASTFKCSKTKPYFYTPEATPLKICVLHMQIRSTLHANIEAAKTQVLKAATEKPALIALPEYFTVPNCMGDFKDAPKISQETAAETLRFLQDISQQIGDIYLLGGSVLKEEAGKYYNTSTLWRCGEMVASYKKINPIKAELDAGVSRGDAPLVFDTDLGRLGMIVCADSFDYDLIKKVAALGAEIVTLPVAAMGTHPPVKGHPLTEQISREHGIYILKVGNVSSNMRGGRSAIIAPWGVLAEASDIPTDSILTADLDMEKLRSYRTKLNKA